MIRSRLRVRRELLQQPLVQSAAVHAVVVNVVLSKRDQMVAFTRGIQAEFSGQRLEKPDPIDESLPHRQASASEDRRRLIVKFLDVLLDEGIEFIDRHGISSAIS